MKPLRVRATDGRLLRALDVDFTRVNADLEWRLSLARSHNIVNANEMGT